MNSYSVPFLDLAPQHAGLREPILDAIDGILKRGNFILGETVERFETEAAAYLGVREAIGVASGTDALLLALQAADVGPGDEVITPAYSFFAVAEVIERAGATAVYVDVDEETLNLTPETVEAALTVRTRAVIPVHLYGLPARADEMRDLLEGRRIVVIEDAAQAIGASHNGKKVGALGDMAAFSFYPTKNLGACGDGGMVTTDREDFARKIRVLRDHGQTGKYRHGVFGWNSRLDAFQAAILSLKLPLLDEWNESRRKTAALYNDRLGGLGLSLPVEPEGSRHVYHQYTIRTKERDALRDFLTEKGIATATHYPMGIHEQPACREPAGPLPVSEKAGREVVCLPIYPGLSVEAVERVALETRSGLLGARAEVRNTSGREGE